MLLTSEEKRMLAGKYGNAAKKSMEILVALGEIYGAKKLIPVSSVQIAGVSYSNLGEAGLEFLDEMAKDGKVKVFTTLNPAGMDLENWYALGISEEFAKIGKHLGNSKGSFEEAEKRLLKIQEKIMQLNSLKEEKELFYESR
ncbi:MAG: aconitase X [Candidatus Omnitrophica bacterium]|nr:aconitase X [Candidatus Omnitrophota bacterium]